MFVCLISEYIWMPNVRNWKAKSIMIIENICVIFTALLITGVLGSHQQMLSRLNPSTCALYICDIQERFRPLIFRSETIIQKTALLHKVSNMLVRTTFEMFAQIDFLLFQGIPSVVTEQYPKAFGKTVADLKIAPDHPIIEKKRFSMITPELRAADKSYNQVILVGLEAHVCVLQARTYLTIIHETRHTISHVENLSYYSDRYGSQEHEF